MKVGNTNKTSIKAGDYLLIQDVVHVLEPIAEHLLATKVYRSMAQELILTSARRAFRLAAQDNGKPLSIAAEQAERVAALLIPES